MPAGACKALILIAALVLANCGGGGGGSNTPSAPPTPTPAAVDDTVTLDEDAAVTIDVLANDVAVDGATLAIVTLPQRGTAQVEATAIRYTPLPDFFGADALSYSVASNTGISLSANVDINVRSVNDDPIAIADMATTISNTPVTISLLANDSDIDSDLTIDNIEIIQAPANGELALTDDAHYTPGEDFAGNDTFSYRLNDGSGGRSDTVEVIIEVTPITETLLTIESLPLPATGYSSQNNPQFANNILQSPNQSLTIPANTVSFLLQLRGASVAGTNELFISRLADTNAIDLPLRETTFCDIGLCTSLIPMTPVQKASRGQWQFNLGTPASSTANIDFDQATLHVAVRTGPKPDLAANPSALLRVRPFITGVLVPDEDLTSILDKLAEIMRGSGLAVAMETPTRLSEPQFAEVSSSFEDARTAELVNLGDADKVNLFFIESFEGPDGGSLLGIAGGITGTLGIQSNFNGILINALATQGGPSDFYFRTTAEFAFHEMGHLLGLFHTTEQLFDDHDVLDDTPECEADIHDSNVNNIAETDECPDGLNPMFWGNDLLVEKEPLTADQRHVIAYTPIATIP